MVSNVVVDPEQVFKATCERVVITSSITVEVPIENQQKGRQNLNLMMLACEDNAPYGPPDHTARMFANLLSEAQRKAMLSNDLAMVEPATKELSEPRKSSSPYLTTTKIVDASVTITIYDCWSSDYPADQEEWDSYHGVIVPGSISAAYGDEDWIGTLREVIRTEIHPRRRPTLGVCFGHQIYAHALRDDSDGESTTGGRATACPRGFQAGVRTFSASEEGTVLLSSSSSSSSPSLLYTHGDMVARLPSCAVSLGGSDVVPVQAAAYFSSTEEAAAFRDSCGNGGDATDRAPTSTSPHAFTFQAHPEFATDLLLPSSPPSLSVVDAEEKKTPCEQAWNTASSYAQLLAKVEKLGKIEKGSEKREVDKTLRNIESIQEGSVTLICNVGRILGWM